MVDSDGPRMASTTEGSRDGYTPFYEEEAGDMMGLLADTLSPALMESIPGSLVTVTTLLQQGRTKKKYSTLATLSYKGKKWAGGAKGECTAMWFAFLAQKITAEPETHLRTCGFLCCVALVT
jgi:hypothetical protein